jgi:chromate reductase
VRVLGICGSLRRGSYNRLLLLAAAELLPPHVEFELYEELGEVPPYDADLDVEPPPAAVARFRDAIAAADAVLVATPEYNSSLPGVLKNALDWASRPFPWSSLRGKRVAVVGATTGAFGAVFAQAELRRVLKVIGAVVVGEEVPVPRADSVLGEAGRVNDGSVAAALSATVAELVARAADEAA